MNTLARAMPWLMAALQTVMIITLFIHIQLGIILALIYLGLCIIEFYQLDGNKDKETITKRGE